MQGQKNRYKLHSCVWEITLACCFSCGYCGSKGGKARANELTTEECLDIAGQLSGMGCQRVSLIGGEVFMRPDWAEITKKLTCSGVRVSIITNGYLLTEKLIGQLKAAEVESVAVSLDGTEEVHDRFRQQGSFRRAEAAIDTLTENEIPVSVITTLHSGNVSCLETLYQSLKGKRIYAWQIQACSPMGNAATDGIDYRFDFDEVIRFVESHMRTAPFAMGIADNIGYYTESEGSLRGNMSGRAFFTGCCAGLTAIGIDSEGNVRGCESMQDDFFIEGNLREKTLESIWDDPDAFAYNRKFQPEMLTGKCASCEHGAVCAGGCRSYNFYTGKRLYESMMCSRPDILQSRS